MGGYRFDAELGRGITMNDDFEFFNERLFYDENTGVFYWKNTELVGCKVRGKLAGSLKSNGYLVVMIKKNGKHIRVLGHRLAWLFSKGYFPKTSLDHINGDKLDNRIENLRCASVGENCQNRKKAYRNNKLGALGVCLDHGKYRAQIRINGIKTHIGMYDSIKDASDAYIQAKREHHSFCTI